MDGPGPRDAPAGWALVNALLVAAFAVPLLIRRRAPLVVLVLVIAAGGAKLAYTDHSAGPGAGWLALNVALYSVAAHGGRRTAIAGAVLIAAVSAIQFADGGGTEDVLSASLFLGAIWPLGRWVRVRRSGTRQLELEVLDDGDGCGAPDPQAARGFGLAGMRERTTRYRRRVRRSRKCGRWQDRHRAGRHRGRGADSEP